jgi:hypothetical protein
MKDMQPDHVSGVCEKMTVPANINDARITKIDRVTADSCDNPKKQNFHQTIIEKEGHNRAVKTCWRTTSRRTMVSSVS